MGRGRDVSTLGDAGAFGSRTVRMDGEEHALLDRFVSGLFGIHFPGPKREVLEARLRPRLDALGLTSFMEYYGLLCRNGGGEKELFAHAVTNGESYFFRETHQFDALFEGAVDRLKARAAEPGILRFLCAGCAAGEEAYTLNIYAKENQFRTWGHTVQIDAFDLDAARIERAKLASYSSSSLRLLDAASIAKYFVPEGETHSLKKVFRGGVQFFAGNLLSPLSYRRAEAYDVIFCRNVLIYFCEAALEKAVANFAAALRPGGLLFLGHSESIIGISHEFQPKSLGTCIAYERKGP
jgi:chemotaxis protein methyltransferase CheR